MKTVSLESLLGAMQKAEMNWQADEGLASFEPLTYEGLTQLRKGEKITVVTHYPVCVDFDRKEYAWSREVKRATVTRNRQYGYTDLKGFWSCRVDPTQRTREDVALIAGHRIGDMVPDHTICYKTVAGISWRTQTAEMGRIQVYRGWEVQIEPYDPRKKV